MTWNFRAVKKAYMGETVYGVHEVYYDKDGNPEAVTVDPVGITGDSFDELRKEAVHYIRALCLPVLDYEEIGSDE